MQCFQVTSCYGKIASVRSFGDRNHIPLARRVQSLGKDGKTQEITVCLADKSGYWSVLCDLVYCATLVSNTHRTPKLRPEVRNKLSYHHRKKLIPINTNRSRNLGKGRTPDATLGRISRAAFDEGRPRYGVLTSSIQTANQCRRLLSGDLYQNGSRKRN